LLPVPASEGRVERNNGVHQDRLVKKLRRQGIQSYEAANEYLKRNIFQNTTSVLPGSGSTGELSRSDTECREAERGLPVRDGTMDQQRLGGAVPGHYLQLQPQNKRYGPTQAKALVCEWEDGGVEVRYAGNEWSTKIWQCDLQ